MAHKFEIAKDLAVDATPEQVWEAIATGPGMDSWFMGHNEIEPREGGTSLWSIGGYTAESTVTAWDPPRRFANVQTPDPDGAFHQFDYRIEAREGGGSTIRYEHTGMLTGDWEAEYEAMSEGDPMYLDKLVTYLRFFQGRFGASVEATGPVVADRERAMAGFRAALGLENGAAPGDRVHVEPEGLGAIDGVIDGVIDYVSPHFLGIRSEDAIYRFIHAFTGPVMVGHHLFAEGVDQAGAARAWGSWLGRAFADSPDDAAPLG